MYLFFLRIYVGFQNLFQDGEMPQITAEGSPNEYVSHNKGDWGPSSPLKKCMYFMKNILIFS